MVYTCVQPCTVSSAAILYIVSEYALSVCFGGKVKVDHYLTLIYRIPVVQYECIARHSSKQ